MRTRTPRFAAAAAAIALVVSACGDDANDDDAEETAAAEEVAADEVGTIVDVAASTDGFSTLVAAVQAAGLVDTLNSDGPFTVFAPTDDAFAAALDALGITADDLLADTETLTAILTYHVVAGEVPSSTVVTLDGEMVETVNGASVEVSVNGDTVMVNDATVTAVDVAASNGVIHVIDSVLLPPADEMTEEAMTEEMTEDEMAEEEMAEVGTILDVAASTDGFATVVAAVQAAGLTDTLNGEGPFTVFAPTDEAIAAALESLGLTAGDLLTDTELLTSILTYHVVAGEVPASTVVTLDGQMVETLNGASVTIGVNGDAVTVNDANVTAVDIEASNGILHVIDSLLVPPADEMAEEEAAGTIVDVAASTEGFATLVAAVQAAGLVDTLNGEGPFTVFAPTDDAFAAALEALGITAEDLLADTETLTSILTYHVVAGEVPSSTVVTLDGQAVETVNGASVTIGVDGDAVTVNEANVVAVDVEASNGVIHVIDSVLLPPAEG